MFRIPRFLLVAPLLFAAFGLVAAESMPANLHPWVVEHTESGARADFFIILKPQTDLTHASALTEKVAKGAYVFSALTRTADTTQASLKTWLEARGAKYRSFWIVNAVLVQSGDRALAVDAARRPDVARVEGNPEIVNALPHADTIEDASGVQASMAPESLEWNIGKVKASSVWSLGFHGEGIVVGGQDTGYRWTHDALKGKYRGWDGVTANHDYNWHDAIHTSGSSCGADAQAPCDDNGHGTHTMGIVLGDDGGANQIGMAPQARWIGCRNMNAGRGTPASYLECFQFFLAPTKLDGSDPDPAKAPDVTNNSWSCPGSEGCSWDTLQAAVDAQHAAGIMTVASAMNDGPACNTVTGAPAVYLSTYTVGATTLSDAMSSFSSRGYATGTNAVKPDIVAPGSSVRSAYNASDTAYTVLDGTSMASPHVAGAVALLWSARACLLHRQDETETVLNRTAKDLPGIVESCGGDYITGPNNTWGNGRLDAFAAASDLCACTTPGVPTIGAATVLGNNQITVSWLPGSPAGATYRIYRASEGCPGGTFVAIASGVSSSPWTDTTVSGGSTYAYKVAAVHADGCESPLSGCVSATATGACTLPPAFAGLASVTNPATSTCALQLSWPAATARCGGPVRYDVYRSATSPVALTPGNLLVTGVDQTTYSDGMGLVDRAGYSYVVRAVDLANDAEDANVVEQRGAPTGVETTQTLSETFEGAGGFDLPGWSHSTLSGASSWSWSGGAWYAQDVGSTSDKVLASPAFPVLRSTTFTFQHTYGFDNASICHDGGTLEYASGPGYGVWNVVPDAWFTANGFNGNVSVCCGNRIGGRRAWCHSVPDWTAVSLSLRALDGKSVKLRFRESDDRSGSANGWYVDSVTIGSTGTAAACSTTCTLPPPAEVDHVTVDRAGDAARISWSLAAGGTTSDAMRGALAALPVGPGGGDEACLGSALAVTSITDPATPAASSGYWYLIRGGNTCGKGSYGFARRNGAPSTLRSSTTCP
jgi:subtilisin family serine protease